MQAISDRHEGESLLEEIVYSREKVSQEKFGTEHKLAVLEGLKWADRGLS